MTKTKRNRNILPKDAAGAAVTEPHAIAKGKIDQYTATGKSYMQNAGHQIHQILTLRFKAEQVNYYN